MTVSSRIEDNGFKGTLILILFIVLSIKSCMVHAQSFVPKYYKGLEADYGVRVIQINSNIPALGNMKAVQEGGSAGVVFGNDKIKAKFRAGFYYSNADAARTINLFETEIVTNIYPLQLIPNFNGKVQPYVVSGITMDNFKFLGRYLESDNSTTNYSSSREPLLGKVMRTSATIGLGIEWRPVDDYNFVHIFAQVRGSIPVTASASNQVFSHTNISSMVFANIGISFGMYR